MAMIIEDMQKTRLTARGVSAAGNPTDDLTDPIEWISTDPAIVGVVQYDGTIADASARGPLGTAIARVTGRNSKGDTIIGELVIEVRPGPTVAIQIDAAPAEAI